MTTAFQSNAFQNNAFQIDAAVVTTTDTHDGFDDDEVRKRVREELDERDRKFKDARNRVRDMLEQVWDGPQTEIVAEVKSIAEPHVERLESGVLRIDYEALGKRITEILRLEEALRAEQDEEDVMILLWS